MLPHCWFPCSHWRLLPINSTKLSSRSVPSDCDGFYKNHHKIFYRHSNDVLLTRAQKFKRVKILPPPCRSKFIVSLKIRTRVWGWEWHWYRGQGGNKPSHARSHGSLAKLRLSTVMWEPTAQMPTAAGCRPPNSWSRAKGGLGKGNCSFLSESGVDGMLP